MLYIANPLYDTVFKFMMEDLDVAKRFIGIIINKNIVDIQLLPQEKTLQKEELPIRIQRLDFVAQIKEQGGSISKVLIEIQKSNKSYHADLLRFRGYLAKHYQSDDLPIITIYILGFMLEDLPCDVTHIDREYKDAIRRKIIPHQSEFGEKVTHDCYIIQVPRLKLVLRSKLSQLLEIFNQEYRVSKDKTGSKVLQIKAIPKDKDVVKVLSRLEKANADEKVREKLEDEEYLEMVYEEMYGEKDREILDLKNVIEEKELELQEKDLILQEKDQVLQEKDLILQEKDQILQEKDLILQEKDRVLQEKDILLEEEKKRLREVAKLLKSLGLPVQEIADKTGLTISEIEGI